jgi:uncharacterized repeat protein (TIGR01451 family)
MLAVAVLAIGIALVNPAAARAASPIKVTLTIHTIWELNCDDNDTILGSTCPNDYYAKLFFPGVEWRSPRAPDNTAKYDANWSQSVTVDRDAGPFPIRIQLWDHDETSGDDLVDIAPGDSNLDITLDPRTGDFSGDVPTPNIGLSNGTGIDAAKVFFTVILGENPDVDGDGLYDGFERSAIVDKNGNIPANGTLRALPANNSPTPLSASPCRPTILVEVDFMATAGHSHRPRPEAVDELVTAFNAGNVPALADCPYQSADRGGGVQLLMVIDDSVAEADKLNWVTGPNGTTGRTIRTGNFDETLRPYYHYSLWNHRQPDRPPTSPGGPPVLNGSSGLCCDGDKDRDFLVSLGGWTGDVGSVREQSGTFMHELGHALDLGHGGVDDDNCKPNYHSVMSYVYQTGGIPVDSNGDGDVDDTDERRLDYSRERLPDLDEDELDEGRGVGAPADRLFFWDGDNDPATDWRTSMGNAAVDWDRDDPKDGSNPIDPIPVDADIDAMSISGAQGCPTATPPTDAEGPEHHGHHDWVNLKYKGPLSPPSSGASSADELDKATADFIAAQSSRAMSAADLDVRLTDTPDPVAAGTRLTYAIEARNRHAANTARSVRIEHALPAGVTFVSASAGCGHAAGTVTCLVGRLRRGATATATVTVDVPADLVANAGGPADIGSTVRVSHDGNDPNPTNNSATATTRVIALADLSVIKRADRASGTANDPVVYTITVTSAGPSHAHGVRVTDDLPDPAEGAFVAATADAGGSCAVGASGDLACAWPGVLVPGQSRRVTVTTRITDDGVQDRLVDVARATFSGTDPDAANNTSSVTTTVVKVATTVTATPVVAHISVPGLRVYIPELSATLTRTDDGRPVVGRLMRFTTNSGHELCTARTDTAGVARCRDVFASLAAVLSLGYRASSTEDGRYLAGTGTGPLVILG